MLKGLNFLGVLVAWILKKFFHRSFVRLKMAEVNSYNFFPFINNTYYEEYVFNILVNNNKRVKEKK